MKSKRKRTHQIGKGQVALSKLQNYREFLLGTSDPEAERRIEEGILDGSIDPDLLRVEEDELIDDYLFGKLSQQERDRFNLHFLTSSERRERLAFAHSLMRYANAEQGRLEMTHSVVARKTLRWSAVWSTAALVALAASFVAAVLLGFQNSRLRNEVQQARSSQDEVNRLRSALAEEKVRQALPVPPSSTQSSPRSETGSLPAGTGPVATLDLQPGLTRGLQRQVILRLPAQARIVWIDLDFPDILRGSFREELISASGDRVWMQEFTAPTASPLTRNSIALPASVLSPGDYQIKLEEAESGGAFQTVGTYSFRVAR